MYLIPMSYERTSARPSGSLGEIQEQMGTQADQTILCGHMSAQGCDNKQVALSDGVEDLLFPKQSSFLS